jgi:hypothetical protein
MIVAPYLGMLWLTWSCTLLVPYLASLATDLMTCTEERIWGAPCCSQILHSGRELQVSEAFSKRLLSCISCRHRKLVHFFIVVYVLIACSAASWKQFTRAGIWIPCRKKVNARYPDFKACASPVIHLKRGRCVHQQIVHMLAMWSLAMPCLEATNLVRLVECKS